MKISKKSELHVSIPTASMPDIVFMLIIFFMVSSVFKQYDGLPVKVPSAVVTKKIEQGKRDICYVWADRKSRVMIEDQLVEPRRISEIVYPKLIDNPRLLVALKVDQEGEMNIVNDIQVALRNASALRIVYATRFK
ncbi:MAG: biopolymer transporter ExbD [Candidatus Delongbacteria bacterium]|nr:biopolymer transporter ExbD [Candidatus Delongbacteria bacterium]